MVELPDEIVRKIFVYKFIDEARCELGTRWTIRTSDQRLRYPKKPIYDRSSARLYNINPTPAGTYVFLRQFMDEDRASALLNETYFN